MTKDEAMKLALTALLSTYPTSVGQYARERDAITALREALAQPQQEPAAKVDANDEGYWADILPDRTVKVGQLLYAEAPQPAQRKPLTDDEIGKAFDNREIGLSVFGCFLAGVHFAEAAHNIKENT